MNIMYSNWQFGKDNQILAQEIFQYGNTKNK